MGHGGSWKVAQQALTVSDPPPEEQQFEENTLGQPPPNPNFRPTRNQPPAQHSKPVNVLVGYNDDGVPIQATITFDDSFDECPLKKMGEPLGNARVVLRVVQFRAAPHDAQDDAGSPVWTRTRTVDDGASVERVGQGSCMKSGRDESWIQRLVALFTRQSPRQGTQDAPSTTCFTDKAREVMELHARRSVMRLNHQDIGPEHICLGVLAAGDSVALQALRKLGIDERKLRRTIENALTSPDLVTIRGIRLTPEGRKVVESAVQEARRLGRNEVGAEHLMLGVLGDPEALPSRVLATFGVDFKTLDALVASLYKQGR